MSARERVLVLKLDDSQVREAIKKLEEASIGVRSTGGGGAAKPKGASGIAGLLTSNAGILKAVAKIGLIAAAITVIIKLVTKITDRIVDSSPVLQSMLKLLETGITFILRPIGDFIAFFLKPFLIFFLRQVALPAFKLLDPIAKNLGTILGGNLFSNLTLQYNPEKDPFFGPDGAFVDIGEKIETFKQGLAGLTFPIFDEINEKFGTFVTEVIDFVSLIPGQLAPQIPTLNEIFVQIESLIGQLITFLSPIGALVTELIDNFTTFITSLVGLGGVLQEGLIVGFENFLEIIKTVIATISTTVLDAFSNVSIFFDMIGEVFGGVLETVKESILAIPEFISGIMEQVKTTFNNVMVSMTEFFTIIFDFFNGLIESIRGLLTSIPELIAGVVSDVSSTAVTNTFNLFGEFGEDISETLSGFADQVSESLNDSLSGRG